MAILTAERYPFEPDFTVPPGVTLAETIEAMSMSQAELAVRAGLSAKAVNLIVQGKAPITPETAIRLERVTGVPAHFWLRLESNFRAQLSR
jgi:HTH-type transcriptional regulator/antitoxin HigA